MDKIKKSIQSLSKREKILIYIMIILIIICIGWFLLLQPQLTKHQDLSSQKQLLETQIQANSIIPNNGDLTSQINSVTKEIETTKQGLYEILGKEDLDKLITGLAQQYKLVPKNLTIGDITKTKLTQYSKNSNSTTVYTSNIQQTCTGTLDQLNNLLDDVRANESMQVTSTSFEQGTGTYEFHISYTVYMIEK